ATALKDLGQMACSQGDHALARRFFQESLPCCRELEDRDGMAQVLGGFGKVAAAREEPERAARLFAAADALFEGVHSRSVPARGERRVVAQVRSALGEEAFAAAWAEGRAMSLEQAISDALEEADGA